MAITVRRPFADSAASFFRFWAGSEEVKTLKLKSPFEAAAPADWSRETSQKAMYARVWPQPAADTLEMATRPFGTSANFQPADAWKNIPTMAITVRRPFEGLHREVCNEAKASPTGAVVEQPLLARCRPSLESAPPC
jgi:hypothetical protein